ncbi:hypothetical protein ACFQVC_28460 [Streptomyces monticola]|uniref:Uncharacterized protein n=1 Tax=Streptomyces monticola TaxID=2666263 RepID=A0ABW2JPP7_9ACTN
MEWGSSWRYALVFGEGRRCEPGTERLWVGAEASGLYVKASPTEAGH